MKKHSILGLFFLLGSLTLFNACKKDNWDDASFRCKINGKEFIATPKFANGNVDLPSNLNEPFVLRVSGTRLTSFFDKKKPHGEMKLSMSFLPEEIGVEKSGGNQFFYFGNNYLDDTFRSISGQLPSMFVIDEFDQTNKRVKGRFEAEARADNGTIISITEGYFDVEYVD